MADKEKLQTEKQELQTQINGLNQTIQNKTQQINELQTDITNKKSQIEGLNQSIADKQEQIENLEEDAEANATQISSLQQEVAELTADVSELEEDISSKSTQIETLQEQIQSQTTQLEALQSTVSQKEQEISTLNYQINAITDVLVSGVNIDVSQIEGFSASDMYQYKVVKNKLLLYFNSASFHGLWEYNLLSGETQCLDANVWLLMDAFEFQGTQYLTIKYENTTRIAKYDTANSSLTLIDYTFPNGALSLITDLNNILYFSSYTGKDIYALDTSTNTVTLLGYTGATGARLDIKTADKIVINSNGLYVIAGTSMTKLNNIAYNAISEYVNNEVIYIQKDGIYKLDLNQNSYTNVYTFDDAYSKLPTIFHIEGNKYLIITSAAADGDNGMIFDSSTNTLQTISVDSAFVTIDKKVAEDDNFIYFLSVGGYNRGLYTLKKSDYSINKVSTSMNLVDCTYTAFNFNNYIVVAQSSGTVTKDNNIHIYNILDGTILNLSHNLSQSKVFLLNYSIVEGEIILTFGDDLGNKIMDAKIDFENEKLVPMTINIQL